MTHLLSIDPNFQRDIQVVSLGFIGNDILSLSTYPY